MDLLRLHDEFISTNHWLLPQLSTPTSDGAGKLWVKLLRLITLDDPAIKPCIELSRLLGANDTDQRHTLRTTDRLVKRLEAVGHRVVLESACRQR